MMKTNASETSLISIICKLFVNILDDFSMIIYLNIAFKKQARYLFLLILPHMTKLLTKLFTFASFMSIKKIYSRDMWLPATQVYIFTGKETDNND